MALDTPFFSIVIPTYGRPKQLAACLDALEELGYPSEHFEVIVVDDGSALDLAGLVRKEQRPLQIKLVWQENAGPASARNKGAASAQGRFLAFIDDDCAPDPNWLRILAENLVENPECLIGGRTDNGITSNSYAAASQMLSSHLYQYDIQKTGQPQFFASNNLALASSSFHEIDGFDTSFPLAAGEDRDFCARWQQSGRQLKYVPEAGVKHFQELTARSFLRHHFRYGLGNYHYHQRRMARGGAANRLESWRFYRGLLALPWQTRRGITAVPLLILLLFSQAANGLGYYWARIFECPSCPR